MIKNIIYDLDGTLINSQKDIINAFNYTFKKNKTNTKINYKFFIENANLGSKYFIKKALKKNKNNFLDIQKDFTTYYNKNFYQNTNLKAGAYNFLKQAYNKNYKNILCTNKKEETAKKILKKYNIEKFFKFIIGFDTFTEKKPELKFIKKIKKKLKINSEDTIVIGDTEVDSTLAKRGNIKFYLIRNGYTNKKDISYYKKFNNFYDLEKKIF
jgi:phosphoglycolate phosphatase-like HAD superfamily hydrolase